MLHVTSAEHAGGLVIRIGFSDGSEGLVDLSGLLNGPIFRPLRDEGEFAKLFVSGNTVCWPNGADLAPEYLRELLQAQVDV